MGELRCVDGSLLGVAAIPCHDQAGRPYEVTLRLVLDRQPFAIVGQRCGHQLAALAAQVQAARDDPGQACLWPDPDDRFPVPADSGGCAESNPAGLVQPARFAARAVDQRLQSRPRGSWRVRRAERGPAGRDPAVWRPAGRNPAQRNTTLHPARWHPERWHPARWHPLRSGRAARTGRLPPGRARVLHPPVQGSGRSARQRGGAVPAQVERALAFGIKNSRRQQPRLLAAQPPGGS